MAQASSVTANGGFKTFDIGSHPLLRRSSLEQRGEASAVVVEKEDTIAGKFNYGKVHYDPEKVFNEYDEDQSGAIDGDELEEALYQLGINLDNVDQVRLDLKMDKVLGSNNEAATVKKEAFVEWWNSDAGPGKDANVTKLLMEKVSKEVQRKIIPMIKALFAAADEDKGGSLSMDEFEAFYPTLEKACGYKLPSLERIYSFDEYDQYDPKNYLHVSSETGVVQYDEFQLWFLENERLRAIGSDLGKKTIRMNKVDLKKLRQSFGELDPDAGKVTIAKIERQSSRQKMSYAEINPDAKAVFETFDADKSGDIDADELMDLLFALGLRLTDDCVTEAKEALGIVDDASKGVELGPFIEWWDSGPGIGIKTRVELIAALPPVYKSTHIPKMKELFALNDVDTSGALDRPEFEEFYKQFQEHLNYKLPPSIQTMGELPSLWTKEPQVEFSEWANWFLDLETKRAAGTL